MKSSGAGMKSGIVSRAAAPLCALAFLSLALASGGCASSREELVDAGEPLPADAESVRPRELRLEAFLLGDRVLVVARGTNATGAYVVRFERRGNGEIVLRNIPPEGAAIQMITPFEVAGWVPTEAPLEVLVVHVASQSESIVVRPVPRLHESP